MPDKQPFREQYSGLPDDQFCEIALRADLMPEARQAAVNCFLGLRARQEARTFAFALRTVVPLALLLLSTLFFALMRARVS